MGEPAWEGAMGGPRADARMGVKRCACCGAGYDAQEWTALPYIGDQPLDAGALVLELRNCTGCDSTLSKEVVRGSSRPPPPLEAVPDTVRTGTAPTADHLEAVRRWSAATCPHCLMLSPCDPVSCADRQSEMADDARDGWDE